MEDKDLLNRIVFITAHTDKWLREANPQFNVPMANRLARVSKVFDWDTEEGRILLAAREKSGKWGNLNPRDFKFVLSVFYPDLVKGNTRGLMIEEVMPRRYPGTDLDLFTPVPDWMLDDILKERKEALFNLAPRQRDRKKTARKAAKKAPKKGKPRVSRRSGR